MNSMNRSKAAGPARAHGHMCVYATGWATALALPAACAVALLGPPRAAHAQIAATPALVPAPAVSPAAVVCPLLLQHTVPRLQDEAPQSLCQYAGKVLLIVNTASFCGFTPQYEGLEALHAKYGKQGLVVLGFPSNDFSQEPGSAKEIADFCDNTFGVKFPMFTKTTVSGKQAHPLYQQLAAATGKKPSWNFGKYLIDRNGKPVAFYGSSVTPSDPKLLADLQRSLAASSK